MKQKHHKILTINFGGLGDEVLFLPTLKTIKSFYPDSHLTLVVEPRSKAIKNLTGLIDNIITCDVKGKARYLNLAKLLFKAWSGKYDIVVSSGSSKMVSILLFLMGIKKRIGYDSGFLSKLLLTKPVSLNKNQYAIGMYHDLAMAINPEAMVTLPEIEVSSENILWANSKIGEKNKKIVIIHPGVSRLSIEKNMIKFWTAQNWAELIKNLVSSGKYKVILVGGPDDEATFRNINSELNNYNFSCDDLINLYGETKDITQLAALIKVSNLLVCVDSAPMHIGVGVKTKTVAIFGPTDENKLLPVNDYRFAAVKEDSLECRPCLWDKRQTSCEELHCLNINPKRVYQTVEELLK